MNALRVLSALDVRRVVPSGDLSGLVGWEERRGGWGEGVPLCAFEVVGFLVRGGKVGGGGRGGMVAFVL